MDKIPRRKCFMKVVLNLNFCPIQSVLHLAEVSNIFLFLSFCCNIFFAAYNTSRHQSRKGRKNRRRHRLHRSDPGRKREKGKARHLKQTTTTMGKATYKFVFTSGYPLSRHGMGSPPSGPGMRYPPVQTWHGVPPPLNSHLGWGTPPHPDLGQGTPPPPPRKCEQTENITFPHPSDARGDQRGRLHTNENRM